VPVPPAAAIDKTAETATGKLNDNRLKKNRGELKIQSQKMPSHTGYFMERKLCK
jgi:hypothetical protein